MTVLQLTAKTRIAEIVRMNELVVFLSRVKSDWSVPMPGRMILTRKEGVKFAFRIAVNSS